MNRKALSLVIAVVMLLSTVAIATPPAFAAASASRTSTPRISESSTVSSTMPMNVQMYLINLQTTLEHQGKENVRLIVAPLRGYESQVLKALKLLGGNISPYSLPQYEFIVVTLPTDKLTELTKIRGIYYVWEDKTVKLPKVKSYENFGKVRELQEGSVGYNPFDWDMYSIHAPQAREEYNVYGDDVKVAVIDTGADPGQPFLQRTMDGKRKIISWIESTDEGIADIIGSFTDANITNGTALLTFSNVPVYWGEYYQYVFRSSDRTIIRYLNLNIKMAGIHSADGKYYVALLPERYFDINFDHNYDEVYVIIITDDNLQGTEHSYYFYPIPIKLNVTDGNTLDALNKDGSIDLTKLSIIMSPGIYNFTAGVYVYPSVYTVINLVQAKKIAPYNEDGTYIRLGPGRVSVPYYIQFMEGKAYLNPVANGYVYSDIVLSEANVKEGYLAFGWDGGQHGTHVSGTIAGYGKPNPNYPFPFNVTGMIGVAPNAQLMEYKALSSLGFGDFSWIIYSMIKAAIEGADVVSMSLGGLWSGYNDGLEDPENFYANLLTEWFGTTFVIAAGNDGPSTNTVGSPGDADLAITVAALRNGTSWSYFYGLENVYTGPASFSSRGPRLDGMVKPDVMAPGEFVFSTLPIWSVGYYGTWASDFWDGTSMATPHVSGAVALLISYAKAHGLNYNPFLLKRALEFSAKPMPGALPIDQGYGLIQVDKAIAELKELSSQKTTYIYAGTTYAPYVNMLKEKELPVFWEILYNDWFTMEHNLPYLYRGIYLRNEHPGAVPVYVYGMVYDSTKGELKLVNGTYRIWVNVPWLHVSKREIRVRTKFTNETLNLTNTVRIRYEVYNTTGIFYVSVDYSLLKKPGTYVGYIYIDDPSTNYIDGVVPVIVCVPINANNMSGTFSDTEYSGQAKHYYVNVPAGTKVLKITLSVPVDKNGNPMGRARPIIATPRGVVKTIGVPKYYFVGAGSPYMNYTWTFYNPQPGAWEVTVYSSVSSYSRTGHELSHYTVSVNLEGVKTTPSSITLHTKGAGTYTFNATFTNTLGEMKVTPFAYGLGNMSAYNAKIESVFEGGWTLGPIINATLGKEVYYFNMGIRPLIPTMNLDLDLWVVYFANTSVYEYWMPALEYWVSTNSWILNLFLILGYYGYLPGVKVYIDQIGPTAYENFERFMPESGYYVGLINGYYIPNFITNFITYDIVLGGNNGNIKPLGGAFDMNTNCTKTVKYQVNVPSTGSYLAVVGLKDEDGIPVAYAPVFIQSGTSSDLIAVNSEVKLGEPSPITVAVLDPKTMMPIKGEMTININGKDYYTDTGYVTFYVTPLNLNPITLRIKASPNNYQTVTETVTIGVKEPLEDFIAVAQKPYLYPTNAKLVKFYSDNTEVSMVLNGTYNETGYVIIPIPSDAAVTDVTGKGILSYKVINGFYADYYIVKVKYTPRAEITINYMTASYLSSIYVFYYKIRYLRLNATYMELNKTAAKLNLSNAVILGARMDYLAAKKWYNIFIEVSTGKRLAFVRPFAAIRNAYLYMKRAVAILQNAINQVQQKP